MKDTKKYRYPNWYWGNYIQWQDRRWVNHNGQTFPPMQVDLKEMEEYDEQRHGWHNSEEAKKGQEKFVP